MNNRLSTALSAIVLLAVAGCASTPEPAPATLTAAPPRRPPRPPAARHHNEKPGGAPPAPDKAFLCDKGRRRGGNQNEGQGRPPADQGLQGIGQDQGVDRMSRAEPPGRDR